MNVEFNPLSLMKNAFIVKREDVGYLDDILYDGQLVKPVAASVLAEIPHSHLMQWAVKNAVYCFPTLELIEWLREQIGGRKAIEICCGKVCLGRHLGIPFTDNQMNNWTSIREIMLAYGQQPIDYPHDVEHATAQRAIFDHKPEVVIGSYVTHRKTDQTEDGNEYGPEEEKIIDRADYIMIGNLKVHGKKPILSQPHEVFSFPWLYCRTMQPELNRIWMWRK